MAQVLLDRDLNPHPEDLRPGHTGPDNENESDKNACPRLVELLNPEYAHAYSPNRGRAFLSLSFSFSFLGSCLTVPLGDCLELAACKLPRVTWP